MTTNVRDDRWALINPGDPGQALSVVRDVLRDFEERLSGIDVNGDGLMIPDGFIDQDMLATDSVGSAQIQADAVGSSEIAPLAVTNAEINDVSDSKITYATRAANLVHAGPASGAAATPTWRALVAADLPVASVRTATTTPITVTAAEAAAGVTIYVKLAAPGAVAVSLPAGVTGYRVTVKDGTGDAAANNITTTPAAGNIDGAATDVISTDRGARTYIYTGSEWSNI